MKKLRDRLNKKGFTLVELIVVIVIILILAAALIPNVMRYISEARMASFKSDASGYLVELQAAAAEQYAQRSYDIEKAHFVDNPTPATAPDPIQFKLSDFTVTAAGAGPATNDVLENIGHSSTALNRLTGAALTAAGGYTVGKNTSGRKNIVTNVYHGAVTQFAYSNGRYHVEWGQSNGWGEVAKW